MPAPDAPSDVVAPDRIDRRLIDRLHGELPLTERPFADVGQELGISEDEVIERLRRMLAQGTLTRFGPLFQIERAGGLFVLAALEVPEADFARITALVNGLPEVAHNYRREHRLNMWFVVAAESHAAAKAALDRVGQITGLTVHAFPKEREYFVGLRLKAGSEGTMQLTDFDRELISATQSGLPLVSRPYEAVGAMLGVSGEKVRERLAQMLDEGLIRRIGAVPNHYRLGYLANGMTVWDVADERVDELGERVGALPAVSHCYRRPRELPLWPYNLFAMVHGRSRDEVQQQADTIRQLLGDACRGSDILYSSAILKKAGLRISEN